jgi:hypothetical protein
MQGASSSPVGRELVMRYVSGVAAVGSICRIPVAVSAAICVVGKPVAPGMIGAMGDVTAVHSVRRMRGGMDATVNPSKMRGSAAKVASAKARPSGVQPSHPGDPAEMHATATKVHAAAAEMHPTTAEMHAAAAKSAAPKVAPATAEVTTAATTAKTGRCRSLHRKAQRSECHPGSPAMQGPGPGFTGRG